jgi:predicted Fe-Mo cluster-binding NifX family protein
MCIAYIAATPDARATRRLPDTPRVIHHHRSRYTHRTMKIATVTDDGTTLAQHFGRARYYQVFDVTDGVIVSEELRDRSETLRHHDHAHGEGGGHDHAHEHGTHDHSGMAAQIRDVDLLIVGGMGPHARTALSEAGIRITATRIGETRAAVEAYLAENPAG